jgi:hypothetical membrane protein
MRPLKLAGLLLFISSVMCILGIVAAEAVYPDYSLSTHKLSDLGAMAPLSIWPVSASDVTVHQPSSLIFNATVFLTGVLVAVASLLFRRDAHAHGVLRNWASKIGFLVGVGAVIVGLLTEQMGMIHYVGAMMVFVLGPLVAIVSSRSVKPPLSFLFIILGLISLAFVPIVAMDIMNALGTYTIAKTAGAENMIVYPFLLWMLSFGTYLMKD